MQAGGIDHDGVRTVAGQGQVDIGGCHVQGRLVDGAADIVFDYRVAQCRAQACSDHLDAMVTTVADRAVVQRDISRLNFDGWPAAVAGQADIAVCQAGVASIKNSQTDEQARDCRDRDRTGRCALGRQLASTRDREDLRIGDPHLDPGLQGQVPT